jgi:hypothetical protein
MSIEKLLAGLVLALCVLMLARQLLSAPRRARVDRRLRHVWWDVQQRLRAAWHWRTSRQTAQRAAEEAIRRAREGQGGEWDGNVYRPKSFKRPKKPH